MTRSLALLFALACLPAAAQECYPVLPEGGRVTFELKQSGALFRGGFRRFGGEVCFAQGQVARIDAWLEPGSVDSGLPEIDAALKEDEFFAVARHPRVTFAGRSVDVRGGLQVTRGTLEMKGKRRDVEVAFHVRREGARTALIGAFGLNRLDYGIGTGEWSDTAWLAAEVRVEFSAVLSRKPKPQ